MSTAGLSWASSRWILRSQQDGALRGGEGVDYALCQVKASKPGTSIRSASGSKPWRSVVTGGGPGARRPYRDHDRGQVDIGLPRQDVRKSHQSTAPMAPDTFRGHNRGGRGTKSYRTIYGPVPSTRAQELVHIGDGVRGGRWYRGQRRLGAHVKAIPCRTREPRSGSPAP